MSQVVHTVKIEVNHAEETVTFRHYTQPPNGGNHTNEYAMVMSVEEAEAFAAKIQILCQPEVKEGIYTWREDE